jgi:steroid delta-isomerase-like uncharacterized protein
MEVALVPAKDLKEYQRIWIEGLNRGDVSAADRVATKDLTVHITGQPPLKGTTQWKGFVQVFLTAFPDLHFTMEDQVAAGDKVAHRWHCTGTHTGPMGPVPPTGKKISIDGLILDRVVDGKVVERWEQYDGTLMMQQLGLA